MNVRSASSVAGLSSTGMTLLNAVVLCLLGTGRAHAIPSPELIVGSFVSLSQLFALASAILGGGAAYATLQSRQRGAPRGSRSLMVAAAAMFLLLTASVGAQSCLAAPVQLGRDAPLCQNGTNTPCGG